MSRYLTAEEKLLKKIFNEGPEDREGCSGCYFKGRHPILEIYPRDGEGYPFRDNPRNAERGILDIFDGIEGYLCYTLAEDMASREAAQDIMIQMCARIDDYLDEHMGKTTPEKMSRFQAEHMGRVFGKISPEKYTEYYRQAMSRYDEERCVYEGLDESVKAAAEEKARLDMINKLEQELLSVKAESLDTAKQLRKSEEKCKELQGKYLAELEAHNRQSKELTKEIKALEHQLADMEKRAQLSFSDDGR